MEVTILNRLENFEGYKVVEVKSSKPFIACVEMNTKVIYLCKEIFDLYNNVEKEAILYHELGHIKLHTGNERPEEKVLNELEADIYAAEIVGHKAVISSLQKTDSILYYRFKNSMITEEKFKNAKKENYHRINNMIDFSSGKNTTLVKFKELKN